MKIKWKVHPKPNSFFAARGWPTAFSPDGKYPLIRVVSDSQQAYVPRMAREGTHGPLRIKVAKYDDSGQRLHWMSSDALYDTLQDAKNAGEAALLAHPDWLPPALRAH